MHADEQLEFLERRKIGELLSLDESVGVSSRSITSASASTSTSTKSVLPFGLTDAGASILLLNVGAALCGSNQVLIKATQDAGVTPALLTFLRFGIAAAASSPYVFDSIRDPKTRRAALEMGLWLWLGYMMQAKGLGLTVASHGALTGSFTVIAVPMLAGLTGRTIKWTTWFACVSAMFGVSLITGDAGAFTEGDAWCIGSALIFGLHKFRTEFLTTGTAPLPLMAGQMSIVAVLSLACVLTDGSLAGALDSSAFASYPWPNLAFMGLFTTAFVLWSEAYAMKHVSSPLAALVYSSEPAWGAAFAFAAGDSFSGIAGWIGAALVVGSSFFGQMMGEDNAKAADTVVAKDE